MILTGQEIKNRIATEAIVITGFKEDNVNPNSYDLTLAPVLKIYAEPVIDLRKPNPTLEIKIPEEGYILQPGQLYLGFTNERTESLGLVPKLYAKSSIARLGINPLSNGGYGDLGFKGQWTLAITAVKPVKIYPNMKIVQVEFSETVGSGSIKYHGKYQDSKGAVESKSYIKE